MRTIALLGAAMVALLIGVCVAQAASPDLLTHAVSTFMADPMMAMSFVPLALHKEVNDHALFAQPKPLVELRRRGIVSVSAEANDVKALLEEMGKTFEAFKAEHTKDLADIKKGMGDVVQTEKVDRINAEITKLQTAIDQVNTTMAALQVGGAGSDDETAEQREYAKAFDKWFRKGVDNGLQDLAVKASMSSSSDPDGGFTVTREMEGTIDRVLATVSVMRRISRVINISTNVYRKLVSQGGAGGGWVGEKEARPETNSPPLAGLDFPTMEMYANPAATQNLLDDSAVDIAEWLADEVNITFSEMEGAAFISGSGVNRPRGILSYDTVANASWSWGKLGFIGTGAADFATEDPGDALIDLTMALKQGYRQNASWLMNRTVQGKVRKMKDDQDNYLWQPGLIKGQPSTLLGYPLEDDDNMSDVGSNAFPVAFGDFRRGYLIVDRQGVRVLRDPYTNKPYVMFYTTKRVGGGVQNFEAIKLLKCA